MISCYISAIQTPCGIGIAALGFALLWVLVSTSISWYRLRHIPGPWFASLSYMWAGWVAYSGRQGETFLHMDEKYGSLVRIGPGALITSDVELIKRMSSTKGSYPKSHWADGARLNPYHETLFMIRDPKLHDRAKARLSPAYSGRDTPELESAINQQLSNLITLIRSRYLSDPTSGIFRTLPLIDVVSYFTLDVISKVALGTEFGCCASNSDLYNFYDTFAVYAPKMGLATDVPWIRAILFSKTFLKFFGPRETDTAGIGPMMKVTNKHVRERYSQEQKGKSDMLGSFIAHGLSEGHAKAEALFTFIAGSETSASAIRLTLFYIMSCPRVYQKLKDEIRDAISEGRASSPITKAEARELPYLQAVIYEGLRMRAVTTAQHARDVPAGGDTINGHFIPGGTSIAINFSAILRSRVLFGDDADVFRPERFIGLSDPDLAEMRRNVELNFGYGRYMCAGKPLASMTLNKVYFELLRAFDMELIEPLNPIRSESYSIFRDFGLKVRVTVAEKMLQRRSHE